MKSIDERKADLASSISRLMGDMSQGELARRMQDRGWSTYSQMTVSRSISGERTIGAIEYEDLLACLGVQAISEKDAIELAQLRAWKAHIRQAVADG